MHLDKNVALTFDDVTLVPQFSDIKSRKDGSSNISTALFSDLFLDHPIISANMDTVTGFDMAKEMYRLGGLGIVHRFQSNKSIIDTVGELNEDFPFIYCMGIGKEAKDRLDELMNGDIGIPEGILIDVAHGHSRGVKDTIDYIKEQYCICKIIAGNVCTPEAVSDLYSWGVDCIKIGVSPGSLCSTRRVTGNGVPQFSAILECAEQRDKLWLNKGKRITLIADGGIRHSGDCVKALAAGADAVMIGNLFASTDEASGEEIIIDGVKKKKYQGMASAEAQLDWKGYISVVEGESCLMNCKGPVEKIYGQLVDGILSGMSYQGAHNLQELRENARFRVQSPAGTLEGLPHGLLKI